MSIATPEQLAALTIAGKDLGLTAPETWQGGTKVALRLWYYREGTQTVVQRGRVTPQPVKLEFKLVGPDALENALYLDSLAKSKTEPVPIRWATIAFVAAIETVEYGIQRTGVSVSLTCLPLPGYDVPAVVPEQARLVETASLLGDIQAQVQGIQADVEAAAAFFDNSLTVLNSGLQQVQDTVDLVTETLSTVHDLADAPAQTIASVRDSLVTAASAVVDGVVELVTVANAAGGLPADMAASVSLIATTCSDIDEKFQYVATTLPQGTETTLAVEGQTTSDVAEAYDVTPLALFAANPELARAAPVPGQQIEVPYAAV